MAYPKVRLLSAQSPEGGVRSSLPRICCNHVRRVVDRRPLVERVAFHGRVRSIPAATRAAVNAVGQVRDVPARLAAC